MSRQNPSILDEMYTLPPASRDVAGFSEEQRWDNGDVASGGETRKNGRLLWRLNDYSLSPRLGGAGSLPPNSYLRRALKHRSQSSSPTSLVQLATRKNAGRLLKNGIGRSPVTVKLAGMKKKECPSAEVRGVGAGQRTDPCDKEVVLSALRQKR